MNTNILVHKTVHSDKAKLSHIHILPELYNLSSQLRMQGIDISEKTKYPKPTP